MAKERPSLYNTAEEIDNLKRTNQFSVVKVFVEGPEDVKIFSSIAKYKDLGELVEISNRGGRIALLELQEEYLLQKSEIHRQVLFFADLDIWVFTGVPEKYQAVHFTKGYSIENDLFEDGETVLMSYLSPSEKKRFEQLIDNVSEWFASQVKLIHDGRAESAKIDFSLFNDKIIAPGANTLNTEYQIDDNFRANERNLIDQIKTHYIKYLRGKFLFEVMELIRQGQLKEKNLQLPQKDSLFFTCIATGLTNDSSNCHRIAQILQNTLNSTPPHNLA